MVEKMKLRSFKLNSRHNFTCMFVESVYFFLQRYFAPFNSSPFFFLTLALFRTSLQHPLSLSLSSISLVRIFPHQVAVGAKRYTFSRY